MMYPQILILIPNLTIGKTGSHTSIANRIK
jgi:hypothetical protein